MEVKYQVIVFIKFKVPSSKFKVKSKKLNVQSKKIISL